MREKLIALLMEAMEEGEKECLSTDNCPDCRVYEKYSRDECGLALSALHLIANGVVVREKGEWDIKHRHHGGFRRYTGRDDFGEEHTITVDERCECDEPYCPKCGKWNESVWRNFCPNCGADMRGAVSDG